MSLSRSSSWDALERSILGTQGHLERAIRQAAFAYAGAISSLAPRGGETLPAGLQSYVDKVSRHAYQINDDDVAELRAFGLSDDDIFELTLATALGAGTFRLDRAINALNEL